jgi:FMN-dependent NADH-azoreductase
MSSVLYIQASPLPDLSYSRAVADAFVEAYKQSHPSDKVTALDIFKMDLPAFDGFALRAKYAILNGKAHSKEEKNAWQAIEKIIDQFVKADKYVMAIPMWNFGIPYRLKHYLDVIIQPGYTFSFSPEEGYKGLVTGKPILIAYARGGEYSDAAAANVDFQKRYMEAALGFMGFRDVRSIIIEPTLAGGPDTAKSKREKAISLAKEIAKNF